MNVYLIALILYSALMLAIGLLSSRKVKTGDDYLLAGRSQTLATPKLASPFGTL
jgi:Na+/proline symporter